VILDDDGKKTTPKKLAQLLLMDSIGRMRGYWYEQEGFDFEKLTERETAQINEQLEKQGDRLAKVLGYPHSWSG
jgi:hypothetical protein